MTDPGTRSRHESSRARHNAGFTLLELMIVIAVIAILAAIVLPSYQDAVIKGRRADGTTALMDLANRMQRYYADNNTFATATLANVGANAISPQGYYTISIAAQPANSYTIQAEPRGPQTADTRCATLTLTSASVRGTTGTGPDVSRCW